MTSDHNMTCVCVCVCVCVYCVLSVLCNYMEFIIIIINSRNVGRKFGYSELDVRVHVAQLFLGILVVFRSEERVNRFRRILDGVGVHVPGWPEPPVHARPELNHALGHHVARAVLELFWTDERAHVRHRGRSAAHHAAHGRHALVAALAHRLMKLVRHYVVADHVSRQGCLGFVTKPNTHLFGRGVPPDPIERLRVHQLGQRARQHLRRSTYKPQHVFAYIRTCEYVCVVCACVCMMHAYQYGGRLKTN